MSGGAIFILSACAMFPTLLIVAIIVKFWEVHKAKSWPSTTGKVVISEVQALKKEPGDLGHNMGDTNITNEPRVEYNFQVDGRTYRGRRVTIREKTADFELEPILARYPVGASVTVYYDPTNPQNAVLERDLPGGVMLAGGGCVLLFFIGGPLLALFFYFNGVKWLGTGFALFVVLFALAYFWMVLKASRWPVVRGRIVQSGVEAFEDWRNQELGRNPPRYQSAVCYTYEVNGRQYSGDRLTVGVRMSATFSALAKRTAARYPVGTEVDVHYNPESPGESVLQPLSRWHYLLWLLVATMFALAWSAASGN
jgi:hypothetical protein